MKRVGAFQAKTHLSKLLEEVRGGETIVITRHGQDVAHLIPPPSNGSTAELAAAAAAWKRARVGVKLRGLEVRELINQGRR